MSWNEWGLKPNYETEELIVLKDQAPFPEGAVLRVVGPSPTRSELKVNLQEGLGSENFFEFYLLRPGDYFLEASWGQSETTRIHVQNRENLTFQKEFGIFAAVVVLAVGAMAWRYLRTPHGRKGA